MTVQYKNVQLNDTVVFLIACCQTELSEEDITYIDAYLSRITDYQSLITAASQHGILPLVYKTLQNLQTRLKETQKCDALLHELKPHYMTIAQRNMLMTSELLSIMRLLQDHQIDAMAFKGPTLSQMAYGDITLRQFGDLDILIRKKDRLRMMDLLLKENYIPEIDLQEKTKETFFDAVNVIAFFKPSTGVRIEVHWELLSRNYAIEWEESKLWGKQESSSINHREIPVLRLEQLLLYLCAHGAKHLFERLEWICDIDRSIRENPDIDWTYLLDEADNMGLKRMLFLGLALCEELFALKLPDTIKEKIEKDKVLPNLISKIIEINFSKSQKDERSYSTFGLLLSMRENLSDKLRFTLRGLFAPKFDDFLFIQLPSHLAFLYPLVRPYRLLTKYFKK